MPDEGKVSILDLMDCRVKTLSAKYRKFDADEFQSLI